MNTNRRAVLAISTNVPQVLRNESVMLCSIRCSVLIQNWAEFVSTWAFALAARRGWHSQPQITTSTRDSSARDPTRAQQRNRHRSIDIRVKKWAAPLTSKYPLSNELALASTGTVYATTNLLYSDKGLLTHDPSLLATRPLTKRSKLPTLDHPVNYASAAALCCPHTLLKGCPLARCHEQKRWKDYIWVSKATEFQEYYFSTSLVTHPCQRGSARGCRSLPQSGHPSVYHWLRTKHTIRY